MANGEEHRLEPRDDNFWKILIIDDSPTNIKVLTAHLHRHYQQIFAANDAAEARVAIEHIVPHLILLDIMMPDADGISLCREIKANRLYRDIPVIFLTALMDKDTVLEAFDAGAADFLTKPIHGPELVLRIRNQLRILDLVNRFEAVNADLTLQVLHFMEAQEALEHYQKELLAANLELKSISSKDPLTGLYNRRRAWELMGYEVELEGPERRGAAMIMLDLDHFKGVNDSFGHAEGDRVLVEAASLIAGELRAQDIAARWGGEEFLVFMPDTGPKEAAMMAERLVVRARGFDWRLRGRTVSFSAGVSAGIKGPDINAALERADRCLYQAKVGGRDRVVTES